MYIAKYLTEVLGRIEARKEEMQLLYDSPRNPNAPLDHHYPRLAGNFSGLIALSASDAFGALRQIEKIDRLERIASIFENLDIDLSDEAIAALDLVHSERRYKSEQATITNAISDAIAEVQETERERAHDAAVEALTKAGFVYVPDQDEDQWKRESVLIRCGMEFKKNCTTYCTTYTWSIDGDCKPYASEDITRIAGVYADGPADERIYVDTANNNQAPVDVKA